MMKYFMILFLIYCYNNLKMNLKNLDRRIQRPSYDGTVGIGRQPTTKT